jgi:hypothetical protein
MNNNLFNGNLKDALAEVRGEAKSLDEVNKITTKYNTKDNIKTNTSDGSKVANRILMKQVAHAAKQEPSDQWRVKEEIELDEALPAWAKDVFDSETKVPAKKKAAAKAQDTDDIDVSAFNPKTDGKYKIQSFAKGRVNRGNYGNKVNAAEIDTTPDSSDEHKAIDHNGGIKAGVDHPWIPKPVAPKTIAAKTVSQGVTGKQKQQDQAKLAQHHQALLNRINRTPKKGRAALMGRLPKEYHHMVEETEVQEGFNIVHIASGKVRNTHPTRLSALKAHQGMHPEIKSQFKVVAEDFEYVVDKSGSLYEYSVKFNGIVLYDGSTINLATADATIDRKEVEFIDHLMSIPEAVDVLTYAKQYISEVDGRSATNSRNRIVAKGLPIVKASDFFKKFTPEQRAAHLTKAGVEPHKVKKLAKHGAE